MFHIILKLSLILFIIFPVSAKAEWFFFSDTAMTTAIELEMWSEDAAVAKKISKKVFAEFKRIDQSMSRYQPSSALSKVNRIAALEPVIVSGELFRLIQKSTELSTLSSGAFDITFASLGYLYDFRAAKQPSKKNIDKQLSRVNFHNILLDETLSTIAFKQDGVLLDLGGIAKGYAVDLGVTILQENGVSHARLSAGGDMRLLGDKKSKAWMIGIKDPRNEAKHAVILPLSGVAISTSGDYERFFIDEAGERVHHILSPKTGRPVKGIQSVSVIGPDAITTDGLSTAIFVLGVEQGLALIESLPAVDVIIIDADRQMHFSTGLMSPD